MQSDSTWCYTNYIASQPDRSNRVFKTSWFAKAAKKAQITDLQLCLAIRQVMLGQAVDLGGGVFKKRLGRNRYRSILVVGGGRYWVYEYLYAKRDRDNIDDNELAEFKNLATIYKTLTEQKVDVLLRDSSWRAICDDEE